MKSASKKSGQLFVTPFIYTDEVEAKNKRMRQSNAKNSRFNSGLERIVGAAVKLSNGSVFSGLFHVNAVEAARAAHANKSESCFYRLFAKAQDGFLTSTGQFVEPSDAYKIAVKSGQISPKSYAQSVKRLWGIQPILGKLNAVAFNDCRIA
jgi:hypothetical protein